MARKPSLSPSKLTTYLACPVKYRWTYVDDRGKWYLRSKSYFSFGTSLHHVLQRFHDSADSGVTCTEEAVAVLEDNWISAGYTSQEEMQQALADGKQIVGDYIDRWAARPVDVKTIFVERQLRADMGDFVLIGRVDRVDEHPDGALEIIDYKSGRSTVEESAVRDDLAMSCYQLLLREQFPDRQISATIIAVRTGASATARLTDAEIMQLRTDLQALAEEILNRDYENLAPVPKPICLSCDFLPLCQKHPGFETPSREEAPKLQP